jgi:hypothetical protein
MSGNGGTGGGPTSAQRREGAEAFAEAKASRSGDDLPEIDFQTFVLSFFSSALMHLGDASVPLPEGARAEVNLPMARQTVDLLALLQEKTKGNLSAEEERTLDQVLYDLRMRYVEVARNQ